MRKLVTQFICLQLALLGLLLLSGCNIGEGGATSLFFKVHTTVTINGLTQDESNVTVGGMVPLFGIVLVDSCSQNPTGIAAFGPDTTNNSGFFTVSDSTHGVAIGPSCTWEFSRDVSAQCPVQTINDPVSVTASGQVVPLPCGVAVNTFTANPSKVDSTNPPSTVTITGQNMVATYAMPKVDFYDSSRTLHLEVSAISVSPDGTMLVFPGNQLTFTGRFSATVYVMDANGNWDGVGGAAVTIVPPPPPPPTDPPPCGAPHEPPCGLSRVAI
jgi:hypothetical protein